MALRQIDIYLPADSEAIPGVAELREEYRVIDEHHFRDVNGDSVFRLLIEATNTEALLDRMLSEMGDSEEYRIIVTKVAATLPHAEKKEDEEDSAETQDERKAKEDKEVSRISREEVAEEVQDSISVSNVHYMLVFLSTIVAAAGMMRDSTAIVIGAMVIAPLIGPNIALALGTTLADFRLLRRAWKVNILGLLVVIAVSLVAGSLLTVDASLDEIATRTQINTGDITLALAAGAAGVLSVTRGVATALIGVMVAVALLPPLTAAGLLLGSGEYEAALGAALLTVVNLVAINLAGVLTFLFQGIRPSTWYEAEKAKRATAVAIALWISILALVTAIIIVALPEGL